MNKAVPSSTALQRLRAVGFGRRVSASPWRGFFSKPGTVMSPPSICTARRWPPGIKVSLATVYNTLHQFTEAGLLREAVVEPGRSYFDTNTADHHHFFCEATGELQDIPAHHLSVSGLPAPPAGTEIRRVDIIVRVRSDTGAN